MSQTPDTSEQQHYKRQFGEIDAEIMKMASLCGIDILEPENLARVVRADASVCTKDNPIAWNKLVSLLRMHYVVRSRATEGLGQEEAQRLIYQTVNELLARWKPAPG
ncbi:MAG TPA: hypothetical protein PK326_07365 [Burkholderiaceae bacterium]|jgi:hypothetical protein|nr:hypothetical protein [Burkholderiaceae bacterium]